MGCLKRIFNMVIFIVLLFAFFAYGGYTFVKNKYDAYTKPQREVLINEEKNFGDLSGVSADYALSRSLNFFGYKKLNALYIPKNQKITIADLNSKEILSESDFNEGKIEEKLEELSKKVINSPVMPIENIEIIKKGNLVMGAKIVPYADFKADVKYIPFLTLKGTIAVYDTQNSKNGVVDKIKDKISKDNSNITSKVIISTKFSNDYSDEITKEFISQIKLFSI